jgi:hypothetical protein
MHFGMSKGLVLLLSLCGYIPTMSIKSTGRGPLATRKREARIRGGPLPNSFLCSSGSSS